MRSLKRNSWPKDELGNLKKPKRYSDFLPDLIENFGHYCCYCEKHERKLDIEHVIPKSIRVDLTCDWTNLLLACATCNRDYKKNINSSRDDFIWPDEDDTYHMLSYQPDGQVVVSDLISAEDQVRAQNTLNLLKLNSSDPYGDNLCTLRRQIWDLAGYWSIWMTVFHSYPEITSKIAAAFPGTLPKYN